MTDWIVDAHHHFWDPAADDLDWMTPEFDPVRRPFAPQDIEPDLRAANVGGTILVQVTGSVAASKRLLDIAASSRFVVGVVAWVDLTADDVEGQLDDLRGGNGGEFLVGVRHDATSEPDAGWLARRDVGRGLDAVAAAGLTFDLEVTTRELPAAWTAAAARPSGRFVLDHLAKPPVEPEIDPAWIAGIERLGELENVWAKVSGLVTEADWTAWDDADITRHVEVAAEKFGDDRLMFGSDWPVCLLAATYEQVATAGWRHEIFPTEHQQRKVFRLNAIEAYALRGLDRN